MDGPLITPAISVGFLSLFRIIVRRWYLHILLVSIVAGRPARFFCFTCTYARIGQPQLHVGVVIAESDTLVSLGP